MEPLNRSKQPLNRFSQLTGEQTGLVFSNELKPANMRKYLLNGAGIATGDYDNDGKTDVFAVSQDGPNRLFRQTGSWKFEDVTASAGDLSGEDYQGTGASFADVDNDGWLDLYVCNINGPNLLYMNNQDGTFTEQATRRHLQFDGATTMASFADYDRDGDLDVYLVNNRVLSLIEENPPLKLGEIGGRTVVHPDFVDQYFLLDGKIQEAGQRDRLYENDGQGFFSDVSDDVGIGGHDMGLSATWWDFDNDGWMDIYVANDLKSPDHLYRNLGNGRFEDVLADAVGHTPWFSMGADAADINNDGHTDLLVADMSSTTHYKQKTTMGEMGNSAWFLTTGRPRQFMRNTLLVNSGSQRFFEAANLSGLDSTDWSWSIKFADFDSDMLMDVFVTNGVGRNMNDSDQADEFRRMMEAGHQDEANKLIMKMPPLNEANLVFQNRGGLQFRNLARQWGLDHVGVSQGATVADLDRDGDLDLLVNNMNEPLGIYRNDLANGNNLLVKLQGTQSNRFGVNARITVELGETKLTRHINLARGFMSADEPVAHFGLGQHAQVDQLTVEWPGGVVQRFNNIDSNQLVTISEGSQGKISLPGNSEPDVWLTEASATTGIVHKHSEFEVDDFAIQPLLPRKLTQLGPGIAWGDVNGDGLDDCYVGGASGARGQLFVQTDVGRFSKSGNWSHSRSYEDMGALFFDIDADGDLDLYVVSGGYEREPGSDYLIDRLYLNDGSGSFERSTSDYLPELRASGSCVSAADFDRDGDLDLFVGTRLRPRQWPLAASSFLLENKGGKLVDATVERAGVLVDIGLVTGSIWSDVDQDGWVDLLLTREWGPVQFLRNHSGKLVDETSLSGLAGYQGLWNSIEGGDVDNDGDIDFVAMNTGLNTRYHADDQHPMLLYARDFDNNGTLDLVEAEYEGDVCYPVRGKSCSTHAMPFLSEKFETFHDFALADITDIYSDKSLAGATRFSVTHLQSVVLINEGEGKFTVRDLPAMAQISPGFGVVMRDFDGDGNVDLCMAQNFLHPQPEVGQMDGGMGMMLRGDGKGGFQMVSPAVSGLVVEGQGMALTVTDLNQDSAPDLLMSINDEPTRSWLNTVSSPRQRFSLALRCGTGNESAAGSQVTLRSQSGQVQVHEIYSGSGYLSQSSPLIFASSDASDPVTELEIRWPDGSRQKHPVSHPAGRLVIEQQSVVTGGQ